MKSRYGLPKKAMSKILYKAAAYMEEHGHCERQYNNPVTGACDIYGAVGAVTGLPAVAITQGHPVKKLLTDKIRGTEKPPHPGSCWDYVALFNDRCSQEAVVAKLREIAHSCR